MAYVYMDFPNVENIDINSIKEKGKDRGSQRAHRGVVGVQVVGRQKNVSTMSCGGGQRRRTWGQSRVGRTVRGASGDIGSDWLAHTVATGGYV